jgi:hypothetical protein
MKEINYRQIFTKRDEAKKRLLEVCPNISHRAGIYFLLREDEEGMHGYIGKSETSLLDRMVSHLVGYQQRIDKSLKSRGFYSEGNPKGWKLNILFYPRNEVNHWERHWIDLYKRAGYDLYNVESGGAEGKTIIGERKSPKTYREGVAYGKKSLAKELKHIITTHHFEIKPEKDNKITQKALAKFWELLNFENEEGENK